MPCKSRPRGVAEPNSKIRVASDGKGVDTNVKHSMVSDTQRSVADRRRTPLTRLVSFLRVVHH
jgi:hypothetical protein